MFQEIAQDPESVVGRDPWHDRASRPECAGCASGFPPGHGSGADTDDQSGLRIQDLGHSIESLEGQDRFPGQAFGRLDPQSRGVGMMVHGLGLDPAGSQIDGKPIESLPGLHQQVPGLRDQMGEQGSMHSMEGRWAPLGEVDEMDPCLLAHDHPSTVVAEVEGSDRGKAAVDEAEDDAASRRVEGSQAPGSGCGVEELSSLPMELERRRRAADSESDPGGGIPEGRLAIGGGDEEVFGPRDK
jgi:hypothetical protein